MSDIDLSSSISSVASGNALASKSSIFSRVRAGSASASPATTSNAKLEQSGSISSIEAVDSFDNHLNETITSHANGNRRRVRKSSSVASDMSSGRPRPMSLRLSPEEIAQQWFILEPELTESIPDAPPPGPIDIGNLSRAEVKRQETIYELYVTESDYVASMLALQRLFIAPLAKHQVLADRERMMLFSNIEQLIPVNQELLSAIQQQRVHDRCVILALGTLFLKLSHFLKLYNVYCANYTEALNLLQQLLKSNQRFAEFVRDTSARPECGGLDLAGLLIKPVQRLCKYPLFLREVLKHTPPDHNDHNELKKALELMEKVVQRVNEGRRFLEDQRTLLEIMAKLDFGSHSSTSKASGSGLSASFGAGSAKLFNNLRKSPTGALGGNAAGRHVSKLPSNFHRRLIRQGGLLVVEERNGSRQQKPRLAVLFSDALVLAKPKGIQHQLLGTDVEDMRIPLSSAHGSSLKSRREQAAAVAEPDDTSTSSTVYSVKHVVLLSQVLRMTDLAKGKLVRLPAPPLLLPSPPSSDASEYELEYSLTTGGGSDILRLAFLTPASCISWHQSLAKVLCDVTSASSTSPAKPARSESQEILSSGPSPDQEADVDGFLAAHSRLEISAHNRAQDQGKGISIVGAYAPPTPMTDAVDVSMLKGVLPAPKHRPPPPAPPRRASVSAEQSYSRRRSLTDSALPDLAAAVQAAGVNPIGTSILTNAEDYEELASDLDETIKPSPMARIAPTTLWPKPSPIALPPSPISIATLELQDIPPNPFWSPLDPPEPNPLADPPAISDTQHTPALGDNEDASIVIPTVVTPTPALTPSPSAASFVGIAQHIDKARRALVVRPARHGNTSDEEALRQASSTSIEVQQRQASNSSIGSAHNSRSSLNVLDDGVPVRPPSLGRSGPSGAPSPRLARVARAKGPGSTAAVDRRVEHTDEGAAVTVKLESARADADSGNEAAAGPGRVRALKMQFQGTGTVVPIMGGPRPDSSSSSAAPRRPSKPPPRPPSASALDDPASSSGNYTWAKPTDSGNHHMNAELKAAVTSRLRASTEELAVVGRQSPNMARRLRQTTAPGHMQSGEGVPVGKGGQGGGQE